MGGGVVVKQEGGCDDVMQPAVVYRRSSWIRMWPNRPMGVVVVVVEEEEEEVEEEEEEEEEGSGASEDLSELVGGSEDEE
ncbi:hypothetical protein SprV_0501744100 [Sparganum proliferum]